jgi:hypothetical protein
MLDGLGIDVGTICALLDLGIQESRAICCVYGRVAHALSNNMLANGTVENPKNRQATRSNIDNIESGKIVIANNRKLTLSEAALLTPLHLAISSSSASWSRYVPVSWMAAHLRFYFQTVEVPDVLLSILENLEASESSTVRCCLGEWSR